MATYTVKRSEWFRGQGSSESRLLREDDNKRCCIGFVGAQLGIPDENLLDISDVFSIDSDTWPDWMRQYRSSNDPINIAYGINDQELLPDTDRERRLADLFAEHGDTLLFVD